MSYSKDYRMSAIEYKKNKHTFKEMKKVFKITPRTYYKWVKNLENNASFHPQKKLKKLCRRHGIKLLFLPAYSPDFNKIENT